VVKVAIGAAAVVAIGGAWFFVSRAVRAQRRTGRYEWADDTVYTGELKNGTFFLLISFALSLFMT
jgi:hypothetical protein